MINTVKGEISSERLGTTLAHEHITCADWSMKANFGTRFFDADKVKETAVYQINRAAELGLESFIDGTPINLGRDINLIQQVAEKTSVNIIVSSGFYYQVEPWLEGRSEDDISSMLEYECLNGIGTSGVLPGIMKAGVASDGVTSYHEKLLRATGKVAAKMKFPIFCHHDPAVKSGGRIIETLEAVGVDCDKIILGHIGDTNDYDYIKSMAQSGCYLGFDRLGYCGMSNSLESYIRNISKLCEDGLENRILLSHDLASYLAFWDNWKDVCNIRPEDIKKNFTYIFNMVLPALNAAGISWEIIDTIMKDNPQRIFD